MSLEVNQVVRLLEDLPLEGVYSGCLGVIVEVFEGDVYEVEFCNDKGVTISQLALRLSQFEAVD